MKLIRSLPRTSISFAAVIALHWVYALIIVPLIDPPLKVADRPPSEVPLEPHSPAPFEAEMARLFSPDAWELNSPKILDTDKGRLFFRDYQPLPDGRIEVKPFTVVFHAPAASSSTTDEERIKQERKRPLVLSAPAGAILQFDEPVDVGHGQIGKLIGGRLRGDVVIRGPESQPGMADNLEITTSDVHITQERVVTTDEVAFRYGLHHGRGRNLTIELLPSELARASDGLRRTSISSIELLHVERFFFSVPDQQWDEDNTASTDSMADTKSDHSEMIPAEVTCRGPFQIDLERSVASFEDQVDVVRHNRDGHSDQLNCQLLQIFFTDNLKNDKADADQLEATGERERAEDRQNLAVQRVVAVGHPVTLRIPSRATYVEGDRLEYSFIMRSMRVQGDRQVVLEREGRRVTAADVQYDLGPPGRLGRLFAVGPGEIRGLSDDGGQEIAASWNRVLELRQENGLHVVSFMDGASVDLVGMGMCSAREVHLWLTEVPRPANETPANNKTQWDILPDKMLAVGDVQFDSPQLAGRTNRLEAWFEHRSLVTTTGGTAPAHRPESTEDETDSELPPNQKFDLQGDTIRVQVVQSGKNAVVKEVTIHDNVRLLETRVAEPGELPIDVTGETVHLVPDKNNEKVVIRVVGSPARVAARGMKMTSNEIHVDQMRNVVWSPGGGQMTLPIQDRPLVRSVSHQPAPPSSNRPTGEARVTWTGKMEFDGRTIRLRGEIEVRALNRMSNGDRIDATLRGETLDVTLNQGVSFTQPTAGQGRNKIDVQQLLLDGGVTLDNQTFDAADRLTSVDHMETRNALVNYATGAMRADGPGWAESVRYGSDLQQRRSVTTMPPNNSDQKKTLTYTHITFQQGIVGDVYHHEVTFVGDVRTVHGPIVRWEDKLDPNRRGGLGPRGVFLRCDELTIAEMGATHSQSGSMDLVGRGNTYIQGSTFEATAARVSFTEAKELIVLEGNERSEAEIWNQPQPGAPRDYGKARRIRYSRINNTFQIENGQVLDLSNVGGGFGFRSAAPGQ